MGELKPIEGITKIASIAVWTVLVLDLLYVTVGLIDFMMADYWGPDELRPMDMIGLLYFLANVASVVLVGRWIYVASWNAHQLSSDMSISPGWAVGWFFIPIANLFKPYQAMKECWMASHNQWDSYSEPPPPLLGWWWGLWIATNILSNVSMRLTFSQSDLSVSGSVLTVEALIAVLTVPLCFALVSIMRQITAAQIETHRGAVFA